MTNNPLFPPGLIGDVAQYIYDSSVKQVQEVALVASLALFSGICGRSYNVTSGGAPTGLNTYLMLMAKTGIGKGGAAAGIERLIYRISQDVPEITKKLGAGNYSSGQALRGEMSQNPGFLSILGEFGILLQQMTAEEAPSHMREYKRTILDLYDKSGHGRILSESKKADSKMTHSAVKSPAFSMLAEGTPSTFFKGVSEHNISEGLMSRFIILEYTGGRPHDNESILTHVPDNVRYTLSEISKTALDLEQMSQVKVCELTQEAKDLYRTYSREIDDKINSSSDSNAEIWNRSALNALKIAGLLSIGDNHENPEISAKYMQWAIDFINKNISQFISRFDQEVTSGDEYKQIGELRSTIDWYQALTPRERGKYVKNKVLCDHNDIIPFNFIYKRLIRKSIFAKPKNSKPSKNLENALDFCIKSGHIEELTRTERNFKKTTARVYRII